MADILDSLEPVVRREAKSAPSVLIENALADASREFCGRSGAWRDFVEGQTQDGEVTIPTPDSSDVSSWLALRDGQSPYRGSQNSLPPVQDVAEVIDIFHVAVVGERPLMSTTRTRLSRDDPQWRGSTGNARSYFRTNGDAIRLVPKPTDGTDVEFEASWKPAPGSTWLPSYILTDYEEAIISNALSRLLLMPNEAWTDTTRADFHLKVFYDGVRRARSRSASDRTMNIPRTVQYGGY